MFGPAFACSTGAIGQRQRGRGRKQFEDGLAVLSLFSDILDERPDFHFRSSIIRSTRLHHRRLVDLSSQR
ncbi:unnamed protein product [Protopolystoma xenopodis]|uniref:Uncharacterized protein n=1 Tax=Protopolystoma xenopodis TaxID=117903 RepID=A0A3S5ADA7_9PLAT|nr:unnamed protein product [Protopolystoma xenopodis]